MKYTHLSIAKVGDINEHFQVKTFFKDQNKNKILQFLSD